MLARLKETRIMDKQAEKNFYIFSFCPLAKLHEYDRETED